MCALEQALADLKAAETVHAAVRPRKGKHDQHGALRRAGERDRIADAAGVALRADVRQQRRKGGEIRGVELQPPLAVRHDTDRLARLRIAAVEQQRLAVCREEIPLEIDASPAVRVAALLRGVQQDERTGAVCLQQFGLQKVDVLRLQRTKLPAVRGDVRRAARFRGQPCGGLGQANGAQCEIIVEGGHLPVEKLRLQTEGVGIFLRGAAELPAEKQEQHQKERQEHRQYEHGAEQFGAERGASAVFGCGHGGISFLSVFRSASQVHVPPSLRHRSAAVAAASRSAPNDFCSVRSMS